MQDGFRGVIVVLDRQIVHSGVRLAQTLAPTLMVAAAHAADITRLTYRLES